MYNIGDIFYLDDEYEKKTKFCNENNLMIVEIDKDENGERQFQIQEVPKPTQYEMRQQEILDLKNWFDKTYNYKEQKYRRLIVLNKKDTVILNGKILEIDANDLLHQLYEEAEGKRLRIQELEKLVEE